MGNRRSEQWKYGNNDGCGSVLDALHDESVIQREERRDIHEQHTPKPSR